MVDLTSIQLVSSQGVVFFWWLMNYMGMLAYFLPFALVVYLPWRSFSKMYKNLYG